MRTKKLAVLLCVALMGLMLSCKRSTSQTSETTNDRVLLPFYTGVGGEIKWGYMDQTGKMVIEPQFLAASAFAEGRAKVKANSNSNNCICWGFIDETGKLVIEPQFDGDEARILRMDNHEHFVDGLAVASLYRGDKKQVVIDKSGRVVFTIPDEYFVSNKFADGLVQISTLGVGIEWGYMDQTGKVVVKPQFLAAQDFHEGLAAVKFDKYGFIDKTGKMTIKEQFDYAQGFSEGLAGVQLNGKYGFIDRTGRMVIEPQFTGAGNFSEGLAWVETGDALDRHHFFIDKSGKTVITLPKVTGYYALGDFSEGLAWFGNDVIDKSGKTVFTLDKKISSDRRLAYREPFKNGVARITDGKSLVFYVDKTGREITLKMS